MFEDPFNNTNIDKLPEFLYTDNSDAGLRPGREPADSGAVIFRCNAATIDEADKLFEREMNYDPKIDSNIGCITEADVNEDWKENQGVQH